MPTENFERLLGDLEDLIAHLLSGHIDSLPLLDDFYDGVTITNAAGIICYLNKVQSRIDDLKPESVIGRAITDVYRVDDGVSPTMQCLRDGQPRLNLACFYRTHRGKMVNSVHNIFPLRHRGRVFGSICFIRDFQLTKSTLEQLSVAASGNLSTKYPASRAPVRPAGEDNGARFFFTDIVGRNSKLLQAIDIARRAALSPSPIFLFGETGTGKEVFAQSIHNESKRMRANFVAINCAAIPENLLEGILFGTARGAFTGAIEKPGIFERANGGTLFLDEINSMPIGLQAKLLRALQENRIRRVGALDEIPIDIKIVSGSNMNPQRAVESGYLRPDLLYRLGVVFIKIPPLRERLDDLGLLVRHFVEKYNHLLDKAVPGISDAVLDKFAQHQWPGNVRELEHVIEGAMNVVPGNDPIDPSHITSPMSLDLAYEFLGTREASHGGDAEAEAVGESRPSALGPKERTAIPKQGLTKLQAEQEEEIIRNALTLTAGNVARAARTLGLSPQLLNHKMKKYGLRRDDFVR